MRQLRLYTGSGGADMFEEGMERSIGLSRIYIGKKVPRLLKSLNFKIKKSYRGRYYRLTPFKEAKLTLLEQIKPLQDLQHSLYGEMIKLIGIPKDKI